MVGEMKFSQIIYNVDNFDIGSQESIRVSILISSLLTYYRSQARTYDEGKLSSPV